MNALRNWWSNAPKPVRWILMLGFLVQLTTAIKSTGSWHPDQHFSVIEFATYKLGITSEEFLVREHPEQVRQTVQVYLFMGYYGFLQLIGLDNAYFADGLLRIITSTMNFLLFNAIILLLLQNAKREVLYAALLVANFSWWFPYVKTLFSGEVYGGWLFFATLFYYQHRKKNGMNTWQSSAIGLALAFAFFLRFQMAFAMVGLLVYWLFVEKDSWKQLSLIALGFAIGFGFNVLLDSWYYGNWVLTPWNYFEINIIKGRADASGTSPVWYYLAILASLLSAPPLSIVLFLIMGWGMLKKYKDIYVITTLSFLLFHFMIGHKEERFLFPVFGILPLIFGYGLVLTFDYWQRLLQNPLAKGAILVVLGLPTIILNTTMLLLLATTPVSQQLHFAKKLNDYFNGDQNVTVYFYDRTPFETNAVRARLTYYYHSKDPQIEILTVPDREEFLALTRDPPKNAYFAANYKKLAKDRLVGEMPCEVAMESSRFLMMVTRWVEAEFDRTIDIGWVMYQCE